MDQETKKEFEELTLIIRDSFGELESQMATKADLQETNDNLKMLNAKVDAGFASLHAELAEIKIKIRDLDDRMEKLFKTETEDVSAFYRDFTELKRRVEKIEKFVQFQAA